MGPQPDSGKTRLWHARGRYRPHTIHRLGLDQKDLGFPKAALGSGSSKCHISRTPRGAGIRWALQCSLSVTEEILDSLSCGGTCPCLPQSPKSPKSKGTKVKKEEGQQARVKSWPAHKREKGEGVSARQRARDPLVTLEHLHTAGSGSSAQQGPRSRVRTGGKHHNKWRNARRGTRLGRGILGLGLGLSRPLQRQGPRRLPVHEGGSRASANNSCTQAPHAKPPGPWRLRPASHAAGPLEETASQTLHASLLPATARCLTAEEMDEQRRQNIAYQYLCWLKEADRWMEACLKEELPSLVKLKESLQNAVLLATVGHCFAASVVLLKKIYDMEHLRYQATGLHFHHTNNKFWLSALAHIHLPLTFFLETTDIYDKKNMSQVIYCIHALSLFLFQLGLAPQIHDLYGKVKFTAEELSNMTSELATYGLQLLAFSKIGGILPNELSVDEAAVRAAVLAISEKVEQGVVEDTLAALKNPSALLGNLREPLAAIYQELLTQAKLEKVANARNCDDGDGQDIYDGYLTQAEIQGNINHVNVHGALEVVDDALERQSPEDLLEALQDPALTLQGVRRDFANWHLEQLSSDREQKAQELGLVELLEKGEVQAGVAAANIEGDQEQAMLQVVQKINKAIQKGVAATMVKELMYPAAQLPPVYPFASAVYQQEQAVFQQQQQQGELGKEVFMAVKMFSAVVLINQALEARDTTGFWSSLVNPTTVQAEVEGKNAQHYFDTLVKLQVHGVDEAFLSWNDLQTTLSQVNSQVQEETNQILVVSLINEFLNQDSPEKTLSALMLPSAGLDNVSFPVTFQYHFLLMAVKRQKAQRTRAVLWLEEIHQEVVRATQDTNAAQRMALDVAAINQAIKEGKAAQTERVLRSPIVALRGVVSECANGYQRVLECSMAKNRCPGDTAFWVQYDMKDGTAYYFHLQTFQGTWEQPPGCRLNTSHLTREKIHSAVTKVTAAHECQQLWKANFGLVIQLHALFCGFLVWQKFAEHLQFLRTWLPAVIKIQVAGSGLLSLQSLEFRLGLTCGSSKAIPEASELLPEEWSWVGKEDPGEDMLVLMPLLLLPLHAPHPSLSVVCRFVHLLNQSQQNFLTEAKLLKLQEEVVRKIRLKQQLEQDFNLININIGLLVKNQITLQEVVSHCKKLTKRTKEQLSDMMVVDKQKGLKSLSKEKWQKTFLYLILILMVHEQPFLSPHCLQAQPIYLAKLIFQMLQNKTTKFMESVFFSLYNYASNHQTSNDTNQTYNKNYKNLLLNWMTHNSLIHKQRVTSSEMMENSPSKYSTMRKSALLERKTEHHFARGFALLNVLCAHFLRCLSKRCPHESAGRRAVVYVAALQEPTGQKGRWTECTRDATESNDQIPVEGFSWADWSTLRASASVSEGNEPVPPLACWSTQSGGFDMGARELDFQVDAQAMQKATGKRATPFPSMPPLAGREALHTGPLSRCMAGQAAPRGGAQESPWGE
ncbi:LOW QUALITY PROTEIN: ras GTPase-activating-like protein IQGAP3 [Rhynchonycteris naso]